MQILSKLLRMTLRVCEVARYHNELEILQQIFELGDKHVISHSLIPPLLKHQTTKMHFSLHKIALVAITAIGHLTP